MLSAEEPSPSKLEHKYKIDLISTPSICAQSCYCCCSAGLCSRARGNDRLALWTGPKLVCLSVLIEWYVSVEIEELLLWECCVGYWQWEVSGEEFEERKHAVHLGLLLRRRILALLDSIVQAYGTCAHIISDVFIRGPPTFLH